MKLVTLSLAALAVCAISCNNDPAVTQPQPALSIYQAYRVEYNITTGEVLSTATFNHGNSQTLLPVTYNVDLNGTSMDRQQGSGPAGPGQGPPYYYQLTNTSLTTQVFHLNKNDGTTWTNTIQPTAGTIGFATPVSSVSKSDTLFIPFSGGPLVAGETIHAIIWQDQSHFSGSMQPVNAGDSVLIFLPGELNVLVPGNSATITIQRSVSQPLDETVEGASGYKQYVISAEAEAMITN